MIEIEVDSPVVCDVDVILYDMFGLAQGDVTDLDKLVHDSGASVVVFSWNVQPELVARTIAHGAAGYLSKALTAKELVEAIDAVHAGRRGDPAGRGGGRPAPHPRVAGPGRRPQRPGGRDPRADHAGVQQPEIAERSYLSINSVKTYIRAAYRKIGVTRRPQAIVWGMTHGFDLHDLHPEE